MAARLAAMILGVVVVSAAWAAEDGKALYDQKCAACHSIGGQGGKMANLGGPLDGVGKKHDAAWLTEYLKDPKSKNPQSKMPKIQLTDEQLRAVVDYLGTLK
jgi:cytochrome c oxidase subunit II